MQIDNLCSDVRFKGRDGDLLLVCPINTTQGRVVLTIRGPLCKTPPLRKFTRGEEIILSCGYNYNPLLKPSPKPGECQSFRVK